MQSTLKIQETKVEEVKTKVIERGREMGQLSEEVKDLKAKRKKLSLEVDGKEESLIRLNDIGLLDEDLLRLKAILERIAKASGAGQKEVKERFFAGLGTFKDITELQNSQAAEAATLKNLTEEKSLLTGEIAGLEKRRDTLRGEIEESACSAVKEITDTGQKAVTQLQQQAEDMKGQLDSLFAQALGISRAVGEMNAMVKKGEESGKSLGSFIEEVRIKMEKN